MIQSEKSPSWVDEKGTPVPISRVLKHEKKREKYAAKLVNGATTLSTKLVEFKSEMEKLSREVFDEFMNSKDIKKATKGNFTWYNFDRSVRVEVNINDRIEFDSLGIKACQEKLDDFLTDNLSSNQQFVRDLVKDAFSTSHGKLDTRKVLSLLKYESKIKQKKFQDAMALLKESIRNPDSKTYYRVSQRNENGEYVVINLNFSNA